MITTVLISTPILLFFGKLFACALLGFFILGLLQAVVGLKINPKGFKFGKEFFNPDDPENIISQERKSRIGFNSFKDETGLNNSGKGFDRECTE